MKKTAKSVLLIMLMAVLVFALTGCGNKKDSKDEKKGDTLVATKTQTDDTYFGDYTEIVEISFVNDKADKVVMTMEFETEETAKSIAAFFGLASSEELEGIETKQEGNKFIMTMNAQAYAKQEAVEEEQLTKENLKKALEEDGFEIK